MSSLGTSATDNLLQSVGDAYKNALDQSSGIPLFGVFLGAIILAIGGFVLWLEMIIRDAAIYICVFFLPLTFVAMIWPATSRWARRLVELLIAIILSKFVIVAILSLATAAITNTASLNNSGDPFEQMIAGAALLVLAAWSPFALLRLIPMMEIAAATMGSQRSSMGAAAGSAGIHSPASYMRQAMDRNSRPSTSRSERDDRRNDLHADPLDGIELRAHDRRSTGTGPGFPIEFARRNRLPGRASAKRCCASGLAERGGARTATDAPPAAAPPPAGRPPRTDPPSRPASTT